VEGSQRRKKETGDAVRRRFMRKDVLDLGRGGKPLGSGLTRGHWGKSFNEFSYRVGSTLEPLVHFLKTHWDWTDRSKVRAGSASEGEVHILIHALPIG